MKLAMDEIVVKVGYPVERILTQAEAADFDLV